MMLTNNPDRKNTIRILQEKAKEILELKKRRRQKRPIIIEFSGSPKSGKTTCINSLELFLRRNGFRVAVVQERASVCPVSDKKSPMFNIWTVCSSIMGMITHLEQVAPTCDVLILDRGVFDALCWFEWLLKKNAISPHQKEIFDNFLCIDVLINRIDIVFAFTVTPEESIKREYANLLTDKPGTIMSPNTLNEYLTAVRVAVEGKKNFFHCIEEINTTEKMQDEVGKEVTDKTLEILKNMLMERIGYTKPADDIINSLSQKRIVPCADNCLRGYLGEMSFGLRSDVENDRRLIQPIPIAVFTDRERKMVLTIKKRRDAVSAGSPEKNKYLLYVGGHSRAEDCAEINADNTLAICRYTLHREVKEEIGITVSFNGITPLLIYTPDSNKSRQHIAVCFIVERDDIDELKLRMDANELILNRGKSKSGSFQDIDELIKKGGKTFESWSVEICKHVFNRSPGIREHPLLGKGGKLN